MVSQVISTISQLERFLKHNHDNLLGRSLAFASRQRVELLLKGLEILKTERASIISQVMLETGKSESLAESEFDAALSFSEQTAFTCFSSTGDVLKSSLQEKHVSVERVPMGTAVLITSYNTPMPNLFWKLAPSYLAGNSSLVCPSPHVATSSQMAINCLYRAGVSSNEIAVTNGDSRIASQATMSSNVNLVSFTGSNEVGKTISRNTSAHHPKLVLELGGTNPLIVLESASLGLAARVALRSAFSNGGQRCAAGSIVLVQNSVYELFMGALKQAVRDPDFERALREENTPLISSENKKSCDEFVAKASSLGADVIRFPALASESASIPSLITKIPSPLEVCSEELFSPIMRVVKVDSMEEAVKFANSLPLRLTSAVWTQRVSELSYLKDSLDFGLINFNGPTFGAEPNFPFGGMGNSGNGSRDAGFQALATYSQTRIWTLVG